MVFSMADTPNAPSRGPVAVLTVSYRSAGVMAPFLESIRTASHSPVQAVVADNGGAFDPEVEGIALRHGATYLQLSENRGYGGGMNAAADQVSPDVKWLLISNPDVVLEPGSIDTLVAEGELSPKIAAVGPLIQDADGNVYPSARAVPSLRSGVGHALFFNLWAGNPWTRAYRRDTEDVPTRRDTGWLSGACVLIRRSVFEELGGFDEGYFMYFEDVDLGYRLGKAGYRNVYAPAAVVLHTGAHSTNTDSANMIRVHHESARRFLSRKYAGRLLWPIRTGLSLGLAVRSSIISRRVSRR